MADPSQDPAELGDVAFPYEMPDADAGPVAYGDLPDVTFDPQQDWRLAQMQHVRDRFGDFGPEQFGEFGPEHEEAKDG